MIEHLQTVLCRFLVEGPDALGFPDVGSMVAGVGPGATTAAFLVSLAGPGHEWYAAARRRLETDSGAVAAFYRTALGHVDAELTAHSRSRSVTADALADLAAWIEAAPALDDGVCSRSACGGSCSRRVPASSGTWRTARLGCGLAGPCGSTGPPRVSTTRGGGCSSRRMRCSRSPGSTPRRTMPCYPRPSGALPPPQRPSHNATGTTIRSASAPQRQATRSSTGCAASIPLWTTRSHAVPRRPTAGWRVCCPCPPLTTGCDRSPATTSVTSCTGPEDSAVSTCTRSPRPTCACSSPTCWHPPPTASSFPAAPPTSSRCSVWTGTTDVTTASSKLWRRCGTCWSTPPSKPPSRSTWIRCSPSRSWLLRPVAPPSNCCGRRSGEQRPSTGEDDRSSWEWWPGHSSTSATSNARCSRRMSPSRADPGEPADYVFFSRLPQALSTEAEMMARPGPQGPDDIDALERIHVTGGTTGIRVAALRRHRPFTPSFIGRAEDQAYVLSTWGRNGPRLACAHVPGLVMRHDKRAFAGGAVRAGEIGARVGDYVRTLLFSAYAGALGDEKSLSELLDPFTGCFISALPVTVTYLRLALDAAVLFAAGDDRAEELVGLASIQVPEAIDFAGGDPSPLAVTLAAERKGWDVYYDTLDALEAALAVGDPEAQRWRDRARAIVASTRLVGPSPSSDSTEQHPEEGRSPYTR